MPLFDHIIDGCFDPTIGARSITKEAFTKTLEEITPILNTLEKQKNTGELRLLAQVAETDDIADITTLATQIQENYDTVVVLGTGGSTLSGQALIGLTMPVPLTPAIHFLDNIDPYTIQTFLDNLTLKTTCFLIISKSGNTLETLSQASIFLNKIKKTLEPVALSKQVHVITTPHENPLRTLAAEHQIPIHDHDPNIGGRFSIFTNVGLLPAAIAGLDVAAIRAGAELGVSENLIQNSEAAKGAALHHLLHKQHITSTVFMPYIDRLNAFASWYRQIWAESLGKNGHGTTPIKAMGTLDQHSQLQLYLDGPKDKMFTLLTLDSTGQGNTLDPSTLPATCRTELGGKHLGDIMVAEQQATLETLTQQGCPTRHFVLHTVDEATAGALAMHLILETIITAAMLDINAFDQPAVEAGKIRAKELLSTT